jgi:hypothetical protein
MENSSVGSPRMALGTLLKEEISRWWWWVEERTKTICRCPCLLGRGKMKNSHFQE